MNCEDLEMYLCAYLDDELEVAESLRLEKHLTECRACRQVQEAQLALRSALRDPSLYFQPSANFTNRIALAVRLHAKKEARPESAWFDWFSDALFAMGFGRHAGDHDYGSDLADIL
jgi:anti-sigma factor RsiW